MLENLLLQDRAASLIREDLAAASMPGAILLAGPEHAGKGTAALEIARALSCGEGAGWNCPCKDCELHRRLTHPDLAILGGRDFPAEIRCAAESLSRSLADESRKASAAPRFLFARTCRKLLRRFDEALWEGEEQRLAKAAPVLSELAELLEEISPGRPSGDADKELKAVEKAAQAAIKAWDQFGSQSAPAFMVRNAEKLARLAPAGRARTLVVERADLLQEAARNALLKVLEEPPPRATFILTASSRGAVMPTLLSRLRPYYFAERGKEGLEAVASKIFRIDARGSANLKEFFRTFSGKDPERLRRLARSFWACSFAAASRERPLPPALMEIARGAGREEEADLRALASEFGKEGGDPKEAFLRFLEELASVAGGALRSGGGDPWLQKAAEAAAALLREEAVAARVFNRGPQLALEDLGFRIREAIG